MRGNTFRVEEKEAGQTGENVLISEKYEDKGKERAFTEEVGIEEHVLTCLSLTLNCKFFEQPLWIDGYYLSWI